MSTTTTSDARFTLDDVLNAARKIVEEKGGDYVYNTEGHGCVYAANGSPSCLVGHVIHALDPAAFSLVEEWEAESKGSETALSLRKRGWLPKDFWTNDAEKVMQAMQDSQDEGNNWGLALYDGENLGADAD